MLALLAAALVGAPVFVSVPEAAAQIEKGAVVIDARGAFAEAPYLPHAQVVDWMRLRDGLGRTGKLADEPTLRRALHAAGVRPGAPVLVYGTAADGWGEEGRMWWTLRYLGFGPVRILDGGVSAWLKAGRPTVAAPTKPRAGKGRGRAKTKARLRAQAPEVRAAAARKDVVVVDVRTKKEFDGATPYLSARGGHVPSAVHLEWRALLTKDGRLAPKKQLEALFAAHGITKDKRVLTYCTGGVRSAFVVAVLAHLGYADSANYDGSWWDWASQDSLPVAR